MTLCAFTLKRSVKYFWPFWKIVLVLDMVKLKWFLLLTCFYFVPLQSQDVHYGAKAGANYSSVVGDLTDGVKFRLSGHAGIFLQFEFSEGFTLQPELLYVSQGFQYSSDLFSIESEAPLPAGNDFRTNVQLNYLAIPVLGTFALNERYSVHFGPQFAFLLNQVTKIKSLDEPDGINAKSKASTSGKFLLDYGVAAGIDIKFGTNISMTPRFYLGLRNRLNGREDNLQNYNVSLQLSINYIFD